MPFDPFGTGFLTSRAVAKQGRDEFSIDISRAMTRSLEEAGFIGNNNNDSEEFAAAVGDAVREGAREGTNEAIQANQATERGAVDISDRSTTPGRQSITRSTQPTAAGGTSGPQAFFGPTFIGRPAGGGGLSNIGGARNRQSVSRAIVPQVRKAIRNRDITRDITRNTALTRKGSATIK